MTAEDIINNPKNTAWHPIEKVYAIGLTPEDCARNWCKTNGNMECVPLEMSPLDPMSETSEEFHWGLRFSADGTGMKCAGKFIEGGVVMTWWK